MGQEKRILVLNYFTINGQGLDLNGTDEHHQMSKFVHHCEYNNNNTINTQIIITILLNLLVATKHTIRNGKIDQDKTNSCSIKEKRKISSISKGLKYRARTRSSR